MGYGRYGRPCRSDRLTFSFCSLQKNNVSPPTSVRSISQSTTLADCPHGCIHSMFPADIRHQFTTCSNSALNSTHAYGPTTTILRRSPYLPVTAKASRKASPVLSQSDSAPWPPQGDRQRRYAFSGQRSARQAHAGIAITRRTTLTEEPMSHPSVSFSGGFIVHLRNRPLAHLCLVHQGTLRAYTAFIICGPGGPFVPVVLNHPRCCSAQGSDAL